MVAHRNCHRSTRTTRSRLVNGHSRSAPGPAPPRPEGGGARASPAHAMAAGRSRDRLRCPLPAHVPRDVAAQVELEVTGPWHRIVAVGRDLPEAERAVEPDRCVHRGERVEAHPAEANGPGRPEARHCQGASDPAALEAGPDVQALHLADRTAEPSDCDAAGRSSPDEGDPDAAPVPGVLPREPGELLGDPLEGEVDRERAYVLPEQPARGGEPGASPGLAYAQTHGARRGRSRASGRSPRWRHPCSGRVRTSHAGRPRSPERRSTPGGSPGRSTARCR